MNPVPQVDVEQIMKQIREDIARKRATAESSPDGRVAADLTTLHSQWDIANTRFSSHRAAIGPFVVRVKQILRQLLTPILARQVDYNAANTRVTQHLRDQAEALRREAAQLRDELMVSREAARQALAQQSAALGGQHEALGRELTQLRDELLKSQEAARQALGAALGEQREAIGRELAQLRNELAGASREVRQSAEARIEEIRQAQAKALDQARGHTDALRIVRERTSRAERKLRRILHLLAGDDGEAPVDVDATPRPSTRVDLEPAFDYFGFEERFRGNEEEIQERQRGYLERFKGARHVLDIGCGRGEFLELLRSAGVEATGIDLDLDMVLLCREKGLSVAEADAFAYLESLPDSSVDGIFSSQMIEHLDASQIIQLVHLSHRKLRPDGVLILETPNPRCLTVYAESFYMDLSHVRLIHPETARFLLESTGFRNVELKFSGPVERSTRIPPLPANGLPEGAVADFNRGIERLNDLLYGYQDYAVIGEKIDASM